MGESSGGMSKMQAVIQSATNLVTTIMTTSTTQVAVVPFSMSVNVGTAYNTAPWVDTLGLSSIHWAPPTGTGGAHPAPRPFPAPLWLLPQVRLPSLGCF